MTKITVTGWTREATRVANFLAAMPTGNTTLEKADTHSLLMQSGGTLLAQGRLYNIVAKHLAAGVYRIHLEIAHP